MIEDYCDSKAFKFHPLFSLHQKALQIHFYYDDVEMCNPLGSKAKIHKLGKHIIVLSYLLSFNSIVGIFYFTLGNLRPKYWSRLSAIHLVSLVTHSNLSYYGIDTVLKPFIDDMKKLVSSYWS